MRTTLDGAAIQIVGDCTAPLRSYGAGPTSRTSSLGTLVACNLATLSLVDPASYDRYNTEIYYYILTAFGHTRTTIGYGRVARVDQIWLRSDNPHTA